MKKSFVIRLFLVVLAGTALATAFTMFRPASQADAHAAQQPPAMPAVPVPVVVMEEKPVQIWKQFPARLAAVDSVDIRPQVSGLIQQIKFDDGQMVNKGDVLFVIDTRPYEAEAAQARADLQAANNQYTLAQKEFKRAEELITTGAIPKRTYDERLNNNQVAKSSVAAAEARLKRAQLNLEYANIKAPIAGRTGRAEITQGNLVDAGPNAPVLTTIVSSEGIYADFDVDEQTYLGFVRNSAKNRAEEQKIPVKITLQGAEDLVFDGTIHSFDNKINTASGTIRARAFFDNKDATLLPGMFVTARISSSSDTQAFLVPEGVISTDQDRKFVYVVGEGNKVTYREVTLGDSVNGERIVLTGLKAGDQVITDGIIKLRPDMVVEPQVQQAAREEQAAPENLVPDAEMPASGE